MAMPRLSHICIFLLIMFVVPLQSAADPPEKKHQNGNSFLLNTISKFALIDYSKGLLRNVDRLNEESKDELISKSANGTVAILLYEFATGLGPSTRFFVDDQPFTREFKKGPAMRWTFYTYFENGCTDMLNLRYQFSPKYKPFKPSLWPFNITQHYRTLSEHNLSQFVLGSFNADIKNIDDKIYVHVWNVTSRKSLFWGLGKRVQRPAPLGNIEQHIFLEFTVSDARGLARSYKK